MALDFVVDTFAGSDGSRYYGTLRNGVPSGLGTCIWPNQCHYDGEWRDGVMHGFGTYVWRNGQRYDGEWRDGRRDGIGIKTYADGSMYDGFWRAGKKHGLGVFRPPPEEPGSRRHSTHNAAAAAAAAAAAKGSGDLGAQDGAAAVATAAAPAAGAAAGEAPLAASGSSGGHDGSAPAAADPPGAAAVGAGSMPGAAGAGVPSAAGTSGPPPVQQALQPQQLQQPLPQQALQQQPQQQPLQQLQQPLQQLQQQLQQPLQQQPLPQQQQQQPLPQQQQQQQQQQPQKQLPPPRPREHSATAMVSPFVAAAALLNDEPSTILADGEWRRQLQLQAGDAPPSQEQQQPITPPPSAGGAAGGSRRGSAEPLPAAGQAAGDDGGAAALPPPAPAGSGPGGAPAPRKLFVREYNMGQLIREYPLTAEEIKMIFGFLWPKENKVRRHMARVLRRGPRMQRKLGEVVYKGHYSYNLMLELQLGIRYSVGRALRPRGVSGLLPSGLLSLSGLGVLTPWGGGGSCYRSSGGGGDQGAPAQQPAGQQARRQGARHQRQLSDVLGDPGGDLVASDFEEKFTVFFPSCGSSTTPAHPSTDFRWNDYAPRVFRRLRGAAGIDEADYMLSLAGSQALRQLNSPGKSGSMFLLSEDERFLVKTMRRSEMRVLLGMLQAYAAHMEAHPHSLITRFFGLHKVRPAHGRSVRFVVMANIFVTDLQIHRRYDLKGSTEGRTVGAAARSKAAEGDPGVIFKDLDVDVRIVLEQATHECLMAQLAADCELLRAVGVMDYSLLLGVHYPARGYTRASLEAVPSLSLDGLMPQPSPLPGGSGLPGSTAGSFSEASGHAGAAAAAAAADADAAAAGVAAVSGGGGGGGALLCGMRAPTLSDDDVQQPPQHLQRLVQQQQHLMLQLQQAQAAAAQQQLEPVGPWAASPGPAGSARVSLEQQLLPGSLPLSPVQQQQQQFQLSPRLHAAPRVSSDGTLTPSHGPAAFFLSSAGGAVPGTAGATAWSGGGGSVAVVGSGAGAPPSHAHMLAAGQLSASGAGTRNWELFSGAAELEERLAKVTERMQGLGFSEQRIKDVAELARLKILGSKLKKSATRKEPPSAVLQAMQQQRQEEQGSQPGDLGASMLPSHAATLPVAMSPTMAGTPGALRQHGPPVLTHLSSLRGAFTGLGVPFEEDEDATGTPMALGLPDPKAPTPPPPPPLGYATPSGGGGGGAFSLAAGLPLPHTQQLGINMLALAVPQAPAAAAAQQQQQHVASGAATPAGAAPGSEARGAEEVVLCFGIIDILQDYSTRKVLERTLKGLAHDKAAISVAPPKAYARRFLDFVTSHVFMPEAEWRAHSEAHAHSVAAAAAQRLQQPLEPAARQGSAGDAVLHELSMQQLPGLQQPAAAAASPAVLHAPPWALPPILTAPAAARGGGSPAPAAPPPHPPASVPAAMQPASPQLSPSTEVLLAAAASAGDMSIGLLGSPGAASAASAATASSPASAGAAGSFSAPPQLVSAEQVSVSVSDCGDQLHPAAAGAPQPAPLLPAVVVELSTGSSPSSAGRQKPKRKPARRQQPGKQQPQQPAAGQALASHQPPRPHDEDEEEGGTSGGSHSPAEAEVIVVHAAGGAPAGEPPPPLPHANGNGAALGAHPGKLAKLRV